MNQNNIFSSLSAVCRCFYGRDSDFDKDEFPYSFSSAAGFLPGILMAVIGAATVFFMGPLGGGVVTAIFVTLAFEILTGWRGISVTVACIEHLIPGNKKSQGEANAVSSNTAVMQRQILFASFYLFRMAAIGLLTACGNAIWIVYVLGGAYLIRGELLKSEMDPDSLEYSRFSGWVFYIIFALIAGLLSFHWSALAALPVAIVLTALFYLGSRRFVEKFFGRTEFWMADFLGYLSENLMFLIGLVLFGRMIHG